MDTFNVFTVDREAFLQNIQFPPKKLRTRFVGVLFTSSYVKIGPKILQADGLNKQPQAQQNYYLSYTA